MISSALLITPTVVRANRPRCDLTIRGWGSASEMQPMTVVPLAVSKKGSNFVRKGVLSMEWISRWKPVSGWWVIIPARLVPKWEWKSTPKYTSTQTSRLDAAPKKPPMGFLRYSIVSRVFQVALCRIEEKTHAKNPSRGLWLPTFRKNLRTGAWGSPQKQSGAGSALPAPPPRPEPEP